MKTEVFDFSDYKRFLQHMFAPTGETRGRRAELAHHLNCQSAFVSQVLNGEAHFSFEHALQIGKFLSLNKNALEYFMLLVQKERAGSTELKRYFEEQIQKINEQRKKIAEHIDLKSELKLEAKHIYYSSWIYAAIHIMVSIPEFQAPQAIATHLNLSQEEVTDILEFLLSVGLVQKTKGTYKIGNTRIHIGASSPLVKKHHINWRLKAMQNLERQNQKSLNYSLVLSASQKDIEKIRKRVLDFISDVEAIYMPSPEESIQCLSLDFFSI